MDSFRTAWRVIAADFRSTRMKSIDYESRPLPRRAPAGRSKVRRRVEQVSLWVRRAAITLALSVVLYNVLCGHRGIPVW